MARRSKDNRILVRIGEDSRKRLARNAALEKAASDRAIRKEAKKAATRLRRSQREIAKRAMQLARRLARERARDARRAAKRAGNNKPTEEYNRQREENARKKREENARKKRKKRPFHPRGPYATEKYTSYARRKERSKRLTATQSSPNTFTCNGYTIRVTKGVALSCTCPDFTQVEGSRNWQGSAAGPFNPCKHMMAVVGRKYKITVSSIFWSGAGCDNDAPVSGEAIITDFNPPYTVVYNLQREIGTNCGQAVYGIGIKDGKGNLIIFNTACFNNAAFGVCGTIEQPSVTIQINELV